MAKRLLIGGGNFSDFILKDCLFVDKTAIFIPKIIEDCNQAIVIIRPRRWGKTLNMSMLHHFLSPHVDGIDTQGLFDGLDISKIPGDYIAKHQGKYPVIFMSFKDFKVRSYELAVRTLANLIRDAFMSHQTALRDPKMAWSSEDLDLLERYLRGAVDEADIAGSLKKLSRWLYQYHHQKVYILIDEYDTPLNHAFAHQEPELFEPLAALLKNFFSAGMKDNPALEKGVMTGILRVSKDSMLSGLNNVEIYTLLNDQRYDNAFGFTQTDLINLFKDQDLLHDEPAVQAWYNGYTINGLTLYNPWSIMKCLANQGKLGPYWVMSGDDKLLRDLIQNGSYALKQKIGRLLLGETVEILIPETMRFDVIHEDENMFWNLLLLAGYLKVLSAHFDGEFYSARVAIPNQEVLITYRNMFASKLVYTSERLEHHNQLLAGLRSGDLEQFRAETQYFLESAASVHDYATQPEAFYHGFMLALIASLMDDFYVFSNAESGHGRPDVILIPKDKTQHQAFIFEFKIVTADQETHKTAEYQRVKSMGRTKTTKKHAEHQHAKKLAAEALDQIKSKHYAAKIRQYDQITDVLLIGVVFEGKTVHCVSEMTDLKK